MAIRVRVIEKADETYVTQRETADKSNVWTDDKTFTAAQEDRAKARADRLFSRLNGGGSGDVTIYQVG